MSEKNIYFRYVGWSASKRQYTFLSNNKRNSYIELSQSTIHKPFTSNNNCKPQSALRPTYLKASFTLEACAIIPMFVCFMVFFLFLFRVMTVQITMEKALRSTGYFLAAEAYESLTQDVEKDVLINFAGAEGLMYKNLDEYDCPKSFIRGGFAGISLLSSDFEGENIVLRAAYDMKLPINMFGRKTYHFVQCVSQRKWIGDANRGGATSLSEGFDNPYVYVTPDGVAYHLSSECNYLDLSIHGVEKNKVWKERNASGHKYSKCKDCGKSTDIVYITNYGEVYHSSLTCGGLKRTIIIERLSEVSDSRHACPKCGTGH